jgi:hypothetical protein
MLSHRLEASLKMKPNDQKLERLIQHYAQATIPQLVYYLAGAKSTLWTPALMEFHRSPFLSAENTQNMP